LLCNPTYGDHKPLQIFHDVAIGQPKNAISAGSEPFVASVIMAEAGFEIVAFAVDLNDKLAGMGDEVRNVVAHRALPAKAKSSEPICLQVTPQQGFGARHRAS
jgi:hypothetical protein